MRSKTVSNFREKFPKINRPFTELKLPNNLSSLKSEKISDVMVAYTLWREYTDDLLVEALSDLTIAKRNYEEEWNFKFLAKRNSTNTKYLKEMEIDALPEIKELRAIKEEKELAHTFLINKQQSIQSTIAIISREISRRGIKEF